MADDAARIAQLEAENVELRRREAALVAENAVLAAERTEALEQQTATAEILRVIASSPTDLQAVLDAITASAARLCRVENVGVRVVEDDGHRLVAFFGPEAALPIGDRRAMNRDTIAGRAIVDRATIHVPDNLAVPDINYGDRRLSRAGATLAAPLLRDGVAIGAIFLVRWETGPFSDRQVALLEAFADQAVIAIENARLFEELEARNRDLVESLDQQASTAAILRIVASSPANRQAVLDSIAEAAVQLCGATDAMILGRAGETLHALARRGEMTADPTDWASLTMPLNRHVVAGRSILEQRVVHVDDILASADEYPDGFAARGTSLFRTMLAAPLLRHDDAIGAIVVRRNEISPFDARQIALLETFADQAVIAIENARLFEELEQRNAELQESNQQVTESLERQTALSEVLRVIASSPTDVQHVLDTIAGRPCGSAAPRAG